MVGDDGGERGRATLRDIFAVLRDPNLEPEEKVVWGLYRSYEGRNSKGAYPGDELLAKHLGRSPRTVRRYRQRLLEAGYLDQQLRGPKPAWYHARLPDGEGRADTADAEPFEAVDWIEGIREADSPFTADALPAGIRPLLWRGSDPPDDAPDGWGFGPEIGHLAQLRDERGWTGFEVALAMIGLNEMGDDGDVPKGLTSGYPTRSRTWDGPELWGRALEVGREWYARVNGRPERVDELAAKAGS